MAPQTENTLADTNSAQPTLSIVTLPYQTFNCYLRLLCWCVPPTFIPGIFKSIEFGIPDISNCLAGFESPGLVMGFNFTPLYPHSDENLSFAILLSIKFNTLKSEVLYSTKVYPIRSEALRWIKPDTTIQFLNEVFQQFRKLSSFLSIITVGKVNNKFSQSVKINFKLVLTQSDGKRRIGTHTEHEFLSTKQDYLLLAGITSLRSRVVEWARYSSAVWRPRIRSVSTRRKEAVKSCQFEQSKQCLVTYILQRIDLDYYFGTSWGW